MEQKSGFTLIELLISMSIVAILSTTVIGSYSDIRTKAKDSLRKQDIGWFYKNLEESRDLFSGDYTILSSSTPETINGNTVPKNNSSSDNVYGWYDNTSNAKLFCVWTILESPSEINSYFIANPNGSGYSDTAPASITDCDFDINLASGNEEGGGDEGEGGEETVTVCHFPPANPASYVTLEIPTVELSAYLSQGAHEGSCNGSSQPTICYLFATITIPPIQLNTYLGLGGTLGPCS